MKDATNPAFRSKYVSLQGTLNAVEQALRDQGIAIVQQTDIDDTGTILVTRLIHESGEWLGSRYPIRPVKQDPQGEGSALTYARRYALMALVGIAPEDDDGNAASAPAKPKVRRAEPNFEAMIAAASSKDDLDKAGAAIASASLDPAERDRLRGLFTIRRGEL